MTAPRARSQGAAEAAAPPQRRAEVGSTVRPSIAATPPRVAVVCDYLEENWPSMDLVAGMLLESLEAEHADRLSVVPVRPDMRHRLSALPFGRPAATAAAGTIRGRLFNVDRGINRFFDYPRVVRRLRGRVDAFHIVDHLYAHLVHSLDGERTIVTCHDLETFKSILYPRRFPRSPMFRRMARYILGGMSRATCVVCDTEAVRRELIEHELVRPERIRVVPLGVHPSCSPVPEPAADRAAEELLGPHRADAPEILHVGGTFHRKRIDRLLAIFAALGAELPGARLVRVGGSLTAEQRSIVGSLGLDDRVAELPFLDRDVLAAVYRRASLVLLPSDMEGFGFPVLEAMACGTPVIASDLPVLREVGGAAAFFCPPDDVGGWTAAALEILERSNRPLDWRPMRDRGIARAAEFTWSSHARRMRNVYEEVIAA